MQNWMTNVILKKFWRARRSARRSKFFHNHVLYSILHFLDIINEYIIIWNRPKKVASKRIFEIISKIFWDLRCLWLIVRLKDEIPYFLIMKHLGSKSGNSNKYQSYYTPLLPPCFSQFVFARKIFWKFSIIFELFDQIFYHVR